MTSPGQTYTVSVFVDHLMGDLEISRSMVSALYTIGTLCGALALPYVGRQIDRRGPRLMVGTVTALLALACVYMSFVQGAVMLGVGFVLIRMLGQGSLGLVCNNVVNRWWVRRRGTVLGLLGMVVSVLGTGAFPSLANALIARFGWRASYAIMAAGSYDHAARWADLFPAPTGRLWPAARRRPQPDQGQPGSQDSHTRHAEPGRRTLDAPRAIDSGIQNVLFADVHSAEELRQCVGLVRPEIPEAGGVHGVGMRRNVGYVIENGKQAWVMIEKSKAMDNIEAMLDVEGLDMVQFGSGDYSVSIGQPGDGRGEETQGAYMRLVKLALAKGVHPRVELGSLEQAKPYLDMGVRHFCVGWDLTTLFRWGRKQGELLEELGLGAVSTGYELGYSAAAGSEIHRRRQDPSWGLAVGELGLGRNRRRRDPRKGGVSGANWQGSRFALQWGRVSGFLNKE